MKKHILLSLLWLLSPLFFLFSQTNQINPDSLNARIQSQLALYPQEKIYVHTDKPYYMAGENMWLCTYLVDAQTHCPSSLSKYVYIELISPVDSVVYRVKLKNEKGKSPGYISLANDLPEGNYTLCAYTTYIKDNNEEDFFRKSIFVSSIYSSLMDIRTNFRKKSSDGKVTARVSLMDLQKGIPILPENLFYRLKGKLKKVTFKKDSCGYIPIDLVEDGNLLYIQADGYKKYFTVPSFADGFDVSFFPEGGNLVTGQNCRIGFKALSEDGWGIPIEGCVIDDTDQEITTFKSLHAGMGTFYLRAEPGRRYYALCTNDKGITRRFSLPVGSAVARSLATRWNDRRFIVSIVQNSDHSSEDSLYLLIHSRGKVLYASAWNNEKKFLAFDRKAFPPGILQVLLVDGQGHTLSERLAFCVPEDQVYARFYTDQEAYGNREAVEVHMDLTGLDPGSLKGSFSVSVTDDNEVEPDNEITILSSLLLTSDLRGHIEDPGYYFHNRDVYSSESLEALMLTQGWRRYDIPSALEGRYTFPSGCIEIGQEISGKVQTLFRSKPLEGIQVSILSTNVLYADLTETDKNGNFCFNGFDFPDSTKYVVQAFTLGGGDRLSLKMDKEFFPSVRKGVRKSMLGEVFMNETPRSYLDKTGKRFQVNNSMKSVLLDEVLITAHKRKRARTIYETLAARSFSQKEIEESKVANVEDLLRRVAGISFYQGKIYLAGLIPTFGVDGVLVETFNEPGRKIPPIKNKFKSFTNDGSEENLKKLRKKPLYEDPALSTFDYNAIPIQDIERIDVIKSWNSVLFGFRGGGGVIMITTKKGNYQPAKTDIPFNIARIMPLGYQRPAEFYSPSYETRIQKENILPDLRTTLYWHPSLETTPEGKISFKFYTTDSSSCYSVTVEGITESGNMVRGVHKISRR